MNVNKKLNSTQVNTGNQVQKRNTIQKKLVLEAVCQLQNHPTAEEVYRYILEIYNNISKGTVYRNLNILVEEQRLLKVLVMDGADRFDHNTVEHNHIKCDICSKCYDIAHPIQPLANIIDINNELSKESGFIIKGYEVLFRGVCPKCREGISGKP
ncbi:MAG: transcriptional repressor [Proteocatella sp.]